MRNIPRHKLYYYLILKIISTLGGGDEDEEDINSPLPGSNISENLRLKVEEEASDKVDVLESIQRESLRRS